MPRRLSVASPRAVVAFAALGTFVIAGSQAQAASIGNVFHGSISTGNGRFPSRCSIGSFDAANLLSATVQ